MRKIIVALLAAVLLFGPAGVLLGVAVAMNPAAHASCVPGGPVTAGPIPESLTATTRNGETIVLNRKQLAHAATIISTGGQTDGVGRPGVVVALMAALTESQLRMLANTGAYPESGEYPNDGDGSDHDSLGLFQMRPAAGWGTVAELMDPTYQARAFYGGPTGPNHPSPRGLLDIPGWQDMDPGEAAQAVEVSAYPDRYRNHQPVAEQILTALTQPPSGGGVPETGRVVFPLAAGTWVNTSDFGPRIHPVTGQRSFHTGTDYAAADGTAILAVADGRVAHAGYSGSYGGLIVIEHTISGERVASAYAHMWEHGIHVTEGQVVTAGQHIGDVGSSGRSTGAHLHLEIRAGGPDSTAVDPEPWLADHGADGADAPGTPPSPSIPPGPGCAPGAPGEGGTPAPFDGADPDRLVDDPTSTGQITARTAHLLDQAKAAYPDTGWACWSPRPGTVSEHPLGRACDVTVGNAIGQHPTPSQLQYGWELTNWLKTHADVLGVEYLIWQGRIWTLARDADGWRPYDGGGMHDPDDVTGGHYDHIHLTVRSGP